MRRAAKIDGPHGAIVKALREAGASVVSLAALGKGCPDLLVGVNVTADLRIVNPATRDFVSVGGITVLMEVKLPLPQFTSKQGGKRGEKRPLTSAEVAELDPQCDFTDAEKKFHREWQGQPIITVRSREDALRAIGVL